VVLKLIFTRCGSVGGSVGLLISGFAAGDSVSPASDSASVLKLTLQVILLGIQELIYWWFCQWF
jgi:hypothetical protein